MFGGWYWGEIVNTNTGEAVLWVGVGIGRGTNVLYTWSAASAMSTLS